MRQKLVWNEDCDVSLGDVFTAFLTKVQIAKFAQHRLLLQTLGLFSKGGKELFVQKSHFAFDSVVGK